MPEEEASGAERKQPRKKATKKVAGLRPRPDLLSNPALSGAASVAARSVLGQGAGVQPVRAAQVPPPASQDAVAVPGPSAPPDSQGVVETHPADTTLTQADVEPADKEAESSTITSLSVSSSEEQPRQPAPVATAAPHPAERSSVPDAPAPPGRTTPADGGQNDYPPSAPEHASSPPDVSGAAHQQTEQVPQDDRDDDGASGKQPDASDDEQPSDSGEGSLSSQASESRAGETPSAGSRRKRSAPSRQGSKLGPAHTALLNSWRSSRVDLKLRRDDWQTHPFRFAADLVTQLSKRVAQDCSSSGKSLTAAQYVDAAMSQYLPSTIEEQLALAEEFLLSRETDVGTGKQASHRVSPEVYAIAAPLANDLREAGHARIAVHVYSGALDRFLRDLEAEGPLGK